MPFLFFPSPERESCHKNISGWGVCVFAFLHCITRILLGHTNWGENISNSPPKGLGGNYGENILQLVDNILTCVHIYSYSGAYINNIRIYLEFEPNISIKTFVFLQLAHIILNNLNSLLTLVAFVFLPTVNYLTSNCVPSRQIA